MLRPAKTCLTNTGRDAGFTLIELIAVLIVVSILGAVVFPRFASTPSFQQRILTDQLENLIHRARLHALSRESQSIRLTISKPDEWQIRIVADTNLDGQFNQTLMEETLGPSPDNLQIQGTSGFSQSATQQVQLDYDSLGNIHRINGQLLGGNLYFSAAEKSLCITPSGLAWQAVSKEACDRG